MNYFEIKPDGQAYIRTDSGTVIRKVGNGETVNHAEFNENETLFAITYNSGRCEIRDRKNKLVKLVTETGVYEAFIKKGKIRLLMKDGTEQTVVL